MKSLNNKIFCSLDIETTGFDPLKEEILEVGFAFFRVGDEKLEVIEEWTQVFKPGKQVPPQILALTGITEKEIEQAPKFSEHRDFLQAKLGSAIILGHNIMFDVKFLEGFGIKFSGETIDTLDLAQWLLPTHHSYNLENLMHSFGIEHNDAHRALADSKATIRLLEKLLGVFNSFPKDLKKTAKEIIAGQDFVWQQLFENSLPKVDFKNRPQAVKATSAVKTALKLEAKKIYNFGLGDDYIEQSLAAAKLSKTKCLFVLPKSHMVLDFYKQGKITKAIFSEELQFSEKKFAALLGKKLSPQEARFALKILVWKQTNWQTDTILDLNLSFFGGQFRSFVTGGIFNEEKNAKILACDIKTFLKLSEQNLCIDRRVVVCGLNEFETTISSEIGNKISWGYISFLLKSYFNFELLVGEDKYKQAVGEALAAGDLFFGLVNALLRNNSESFQYFKISPETYYSEKYVRIRQAAEHYAEKLVELNKVFKSEAITAFAASLNSFFSEEANRVKWMELAETRCALFSMPVEISELVSETFKPYKQVIFLDCLGPKIVSQFFIRRLGLEDYTLENIQAGTVGKKTSSMKQGDLFSGLKKVLGLNKNVSYQTFPQTPSPKDILEIVKSPSQYPAAVLFASVLDARKFYEENYKELKTHSSVFVQSASGGSNKIFRNFSIDPKSLLLATDKFILKSTAGSSQVEPVEHLNVKRLVICRLPFEQFTHPYQEAVSKSFPNAFVDYALPRAVFNLHALIKFFYSPQLKNVYVYDPKLAKDYAVPFKDYENLFNS